MSRLSACVLLLATSAAACTTARGRADQAFQRADYVAAAAQYDALLARDPGDSTLRARRDAARASALTALTMEARDHRLAGRTEAALAAVGRMVARRDAWPDHAATWTAAAMRTETAAAGAVVQGQVRGKLAAEPLGAEAALDQRHRQLGAAELAPLWSELAAEVRASGQAHCKIAIPADAAASPYLARLTAAYCAHVGVFAPTAARLPDGVTAFTVSGEIAGMTASQQTRLESVLDAGLRTSPWYEPAAGASTAAVSLAGSQAVDYARRRVTLHAPWTELVTYEVQEQYQEQYQEPYKEEYQEAYQEEYQEPYQHQVTETTQVTESYECGTGSEPRTCTRSLPKTTQRTETRHRTAHRTAYRTAYRTAFRTAYRQAYRTVTKTREEARSYSYRAIERTGSYAASWALSVQLGTRPLPLRLDATDHQLGHDHDSTFAPAGVAPSRANLDSLDTWFERLQRRLGAELPSRLVEQWQVSFCNEARYSAETAARCGYGASVPPAARGELSRLFGGDVDRVIAAYAPHAAGR